MKPSVAAAGLLALLLAPGASAHYGTAKLGYRSSVVAVKPRIPGLQFKVLYGDDLLSLENRSGKTVLIKGYSGEPYLRFSPDGIYVNVNSPAGYLNQDRYGKATVPKSATPKARPGWEKLAGAKVWAWHDHRIHFMSPDLPPQIKEEPRKPHHVFDWKVPATAAGKRFLVAGSLDYEPPPKKEGFPVALAIALATLIGAGMVGLFALRRVLLRSLD